MINGRRFCAPARERCCGLGRAKNVAAGGCPIGLAKGSRIEPVGEVWEDGAIPVAVVIIGRGPVGSAVVPAINAILSISLVER